MEKEDYLPLFLVMDNENHCYVVDDQILINRIGGWAGHYPFRAFDLLTQLYHNSNSKKAIPEKFHRYFKPSYTLTDRELVRYLIGDVDVAPGHIVDLELDLSSSEKITLTNVYYQNHFKVTRLPSFSISHREAFLIFANILSNERCYSYRQDIAQVHSSFDDIEIKEDSSFVHTGHLKLIGSDYMRIVTFGLDYLFYLKEQLLNGSITPYEIAFYGGIRTLCHLSHIPIVKEYATQLLPQIQDLLINSRNEKIVTFCFLNALKFYSPLGKELHLRDSFLLKRLEKEVYNDYPKYPLK